MASSEGKHGRWNLKAPARIKNGSHGSATIDSVSRLKLTGFQRQKRGGVSPEWFWHKSENQKYLCKHHLYMSPITFHEPNRSEKPCSGLRDHMAVEFLHDFLQHVQRLMSELFLLISGHQIAFFFTVVLIWNKMNHKKNKNYLLYLINPHYISNNNQMFFGFLVKLWNNNPHRSELTPWSFGPLGQNVATNPEPERDRLVWKKAPRYWRRFNRK